MSEEKEETNLKRSREEAEEATADTAEPATKVSKPNPGDGDGEAEASDCPDDPAQDGTNNADPPQDEKPDGGNPGKKEDDPKPDGDDPKPDGDDPKPDGDPAPEPEQPEAPNADTSKEGKPAAGGQPETKEAQAATAETPSKTTEETKTEVSPSGVSGLPTDAPVDPAQAATVTNEDSIVEERAELAPEFVGRVIGKGGEMIRDLQARSGCRVDVDQNVLEGDPRIITYRGTRKAVNFAMQLVATLVAQGKEADLPLGQATQKQIIVPSQSIGKVIGRGGEMIRDLQNRSKAKIQVDHSGAGVSDPNMRAVNITGTVDAVTKAEEMIMFLVANPMMDAAEAINMLVDDKVRSGTPWGTGPPYPNLPNQGQGMQVGAGYQGYSSSGQPPAGGGYYQQQPVGAPYGSYYGSAGAAGPEIEVFHAAKMYMGRIIGQRGITINDLQKRSGCDIQINQDVPPGHDCEISIKGSRQGIESTKAMLRDIIEMGPSHPYAGGTGQQPGGYAPTGYEQGGYAPVPAVAMPAYQYQQPQAQPGPYGYPYGGPPYQQPPMYGQPEMPPYQATSPPQQYPMSQPQYGGYPPQHPPQPPPSTWRTATTADGQTYYYNEKTGETQWEKPMGM